MTLTPVEQMQIEIYDMEGCTHKKVPGMYKFIVENAEQYVGGDAALAEQLRTSAANRKLPGFSIPQDQFREMCGIWAAAYRLGDFPIDVGAITYRDTGSRFMRVRYEGRAVGLLTSGTEEFARILCNDLVMIGPDDDAPLFEPLSNLVDECFLSGAVGDKNNQETFGRLWETKQGRIAAVFDDEVPVCEAAVAGFKQAGGSPRIYLVNRKATYDSLIKGNYSNLQGELRERVQALEAQGVERIRDFEQATALETVVDAHDPSGRRPRLR